MSDDKRELERRAKGALSAGRPREALEPLWTLVNRSHLMGDELRRYLSMMGDAYHRLGRFRAASTIALFSGDMRTAANLSAEHGLDLARSFQGANDHSGAAQHYEAAGWLGHAAIHLEEAGNNRGARVLWHNLAAAESLRDEPYVQGLVRFNLGRVCAELGDKKAARRHTIEATHLLEAASDGYETQGMRERAFDCYQVILTMGKDRAFENLAEGYLNCIRILGEDNLKYYVLQYYEDFQELALERGELHAAATLFREAADYARRQGMPYARHYQRRGAETHMQAGRKILVDGGSPEMAENAYAAAVGAFNDLGLYSKVREIYGALAELPLGDKRQARYQKLRVRLKDLKDDNSPMPSFPDYLRMDTAYPEIWRLDVIEWEQGGDPAETMAEVLLDRKWPDFTRRRALLCRLAQLGMGEEQPSEQTLIVVAELLGKVEIYSSLAPLEKMFESDSVPVRAAVIRAVRQLFFKRSFGLVTRALKDPEAAVRKEAMAAVAALHFGHAFDPLSRIYRESTVAVVRKAALSSIGKIPSVAAAEFLIDVMRHGTAAEKSLTHQLLIRADHADVNSLLQRAAASETGELAGTFMAILQQRR